ncbi:hypothetical protein [Arthrobacter sp. CG_A4]|uniref:hypothetical protein n=1 Tax=Arthrobacter sp. CG_A4 TaxID=3071706 RepID=UPI002E151359
MLPTKVLSKLSFGGGGRRPPLGGSWPVAGQVVGIIADEDSDLDSVRTARAALDAAGIVPLVIAPTGGFLGGPDGGIPVRRSYLAARSTEFDAVLVAGSGAPAPDAAQGRDAKAGEPGRRLTRELCCCFPGRSGTLRQ